MYSQPGVAGQQTSGENAERRSGRADGAPETERLVPLGAFLEHVHDDRESCRQDDRRPDSLQGTHRDQRPLVRRQTAAERSEREDHEPGHEDAAPSEQVGGATAEQEQAAERQAVRGHHPLEVRLGEVEIASDGRKRDVDDRQVGDRDEERDGEECKGSPAMNGCGHEWNSLCL